jgi:hypothetical protein
MSAVQGGLAVNGTPIAAATMQVSPMFLLTHNRSV